MNFKFGRNYSLKSQKEINAIFDHGKQITSYPFIVFYIEEELSKQETPFKIVFSAPKRTFRKAYQRNRIKRIMREAIRLNKQSFEDELKNKNRFIKLFLIYGQKEEIGYNLLQKKTNKLFKKILSSLHE